MSERLVERELRILEWLHKRGSLYPSALAHLIEGLASTGKVARYEGVCVELAERGLVRETGRTWNRKAVRYEITDEGARAIGKRPDAVTR